MASSDTCRKTCLTDAELAAFHARELDAKTAAAFAEHLARCPTCAARDRALVDEHQSWIARVQSVGSTLKQLLDQQPRTALVPRTIAGYEILGEIRRGGQGIVYRAIQQSTKREVAIKILLEGRYAAPGTRRRFEREIELVATLRHPHIVTIFDSGQTEEGDLYCVMDLLRGRPLDQHVAHRRPARDELLRLFVQICQTVNYAHQRGVLHRDLKPSNILVDDEGEPHVLDFGLARPLAHGRTITGRDGPAVAGTLPYLSPEQARGLPDALDVRSDVHALGVILYELLTGTYPYEVSDNVLETLRRIAQQPPVRPSDARRAARRGAAAPNGDNAPRYEVDAELEAVVLKALAKQSDHRYQTAGDFAADLSRYLRGEPIAAKRDSTLANWYVLRKTLHRYRATAAVVGAFALVVLVGAIASTVLWRQAVEQRDAARAAETKARERFDQLRDLARFFVIDVQALMNQLPGAAPIRAQLVEKGQDYLELLAAEAGDNVDLLVEMAGGHINLGDTLGATEMSHLGRFDEALAEYGRALELLERILQLDPGRAQAESFRLLARLRIADIRQSQGRLADAIATYEAVIAEARAAIEAHPDSAELRRHLASAHDRVGLVYERLGRLAEARTHFDQSVAASSPEDPNHPAAGPYARRNATVAIVRQATRAYSEGRRAEALVHYRRFLEMSEAARAAHPDFFAFQRDVVIGHQWVGILLAELGQPEPAIDAFASALRTAETLLEIDPTHDAVRSDMATTCIKLAEAHFALGRLDESEQAAWRCIRLCEEILARDPGLGPTRRLLGVGHYKRYEVETARAADETASAPTRESHQQAACDALATCLAEFERLETEALLEPADAGVPAELAGELAACRGKLPAP